MRAYLLSSAREFCFGFSVASGQSEGPDLNAMISVVCHVSSQNLPELGLILRFYSSEHDVKRRHFTVLGLVADFYV